MSSPNFNQYSMLINIKIKSLEQKDPVKTDDGPRIFNLQKFVAFPSEPLVFTL